MYSNSLVLIMNFMNKQGETALKLFIPFLYIFDKSIYLHFTDQGEESEGSRC